ncbi:MAG: PAS domain S-box protein [Bdellovibrionaceae bacterium]|nr:PAS domain S-box protein [Pseudobdellovibrionaceae bacterium]
MSLTGEWLLVNQRLCDIVGYSKDELLRITFQDITHPEDLSADLSYVEQMLRGDIQTYSLEKRYIRKDTSYVWINLTVSLVKNDQGSPLYFISVIEDIHKRKMMEVEIRKIHEEMEQTIEKRTAALRMEVAERRRAEKDRNNFFELSSDLIAIFGYNGYLKAANPSLRKCLGYSEHELMSRPFFEFIYPDYLGRTLEAGLDFLKTGRYPGIENRYICKDGSVVTLSWSVTGVPEDDCIYAAARNVTELRKKELEIAEQKVKIAANSKMNALGRMASGIAHEINNPLTVVYGQASLLQKMVSDDHLEKAKILTTAQSMEKMCERIVRIINGLRAFSRDGANDPLEFAPASKILNETLSFCQGRIQRFGITLVADEISENIEFYCRPVQISQVLLNLLNNSIDSVKDMENGRIQIKLVDTPDSVGFSITDNGPGIKKEHVANLFTPFFTTKDIGNGTGLGLSIAKGIMDSHGGSICLNTDIAETCFIFLLPKVIK